MGDVVIKLKVMPIGPEADLSKIKEACEQKIKAAGGIVHKTSEEPVAFGLKSIVFVFLLDEKSANTDKLEAELRQIPDVQSTEIVDVRKAFG
ncbi:MAG: elongation factor 1-beta [Candidatus Nanoarchaeia archaeon]